MKQNIVTSFSMRSLVATLLLMILFLVSCQPTNNVQSTYTPQQPQDIGGGCGVVSSEESSDYVVKYVEIKNSF